MANRPELRIGDADREASAASLREHYAQGRLSLEEFNQRLDAVFAATTQSQLDQITGDLPHVRIPAAPLPVAAASTNPGSGSTRGGPRGQRHRTGAGAALGMAGSLLAILIIWLFVLSPHLNFRLFWLPGRWSVVAIGLVILRSLFRRVFGGRWADGSGHAGRYGGGHGHSGRPW
jgi:hypothetical protein